MSTYVMAPKHWIVYDGKSTNDFNVYTSGEATFSSPERNYESIDILGRNGSLTVDYGTFKNINVTYRCFIPYDLEKNLRAFRSFLGSKHGYFKLEDTRHPDEYRMARFVSALDVNSARLEVGSFELTFDCKPQRYLINGNEVKTFSSNGTIINPTYQIAKPLIKINGTSTGTLAIGDARISVALTSSVSSLYFDTELLDAYSMSGTTKVSRNSLVSDSISGNYIHGIEGMELDPGSNAITKTGGITSVEITPRWWTL